MSSVQRFIRQIQPDNTYYSAANVLSAIATNAYELVPSAGAVGNYPAGVMTAAGSGALFTGISNAVAANTAANLLLRDMGKTVKASLAAGGVGYFRQVQLLAPAAANAAVLNGGVLGAVSAPDAYTPYMTFYVSVAVAGVAAAAIPSHGLSGQM
jgi:hypothetical protein